jgi:excisionase family DNA binding protein
MTCELKDQAEPKRVKVRQAAAHLGVSPQMIYRLFHGGELRGLQIGRAVRIDRDSLLAYEAAHQNKGPEVPIPPAPPTPADPPTPWPRRRAKRAAGFQFFPR